ncbi:MAG: NUDIX hydrolase [Chloroflexi bacterium]|nr:NUDIX hydrolase [Chloroflexota bacterium]
MAELGEWQRIDSEVLGDYYIFKLRQDRRLHPRSGRALRFYVLEAPDWINIIPITDTGEVVMVRQFRHGSEEFTLEVPGGMIDPGEDPLTAARRELLEETGYDCDSIVPLGNVAPNPAFQNNRCHTFLALGARSTAAQTLGDGEDISIELAPLAEIPQYIADGRISHALVIAAFYFYELHKMGDRQ